jgi:hypothetical protein
VLAAVRNVIVGSHDCGGHAGVPLPHWSLAAGKIAAGRPPLGHRLEQGSSWPCWAGPVSWTGQERSGLGKEGERGAPGWARLGQRERGAWAELVKWIFFLSNFLLF